MNIGFSINDAGLVVVVLLSMLLVPFALAMVSGLLARLLRLNGDFALVFTVVGTIGLLVGSSFWLDQAGHAVQGLTITKTEQVSIRREGDWRTTLQAGLLYHQDGSAVDAPAFTMSSGDIGYLPSAADSSVRLTLPPAQYDTLHKGAPVALRVLPIWGSVSLVRLEMVRTRDWVRWDWLAIGVGALVLGWLVFRLGRTKIGCLLVLALATIGGIGVPGVVVYRQWQAMEDLSAKPLRAEATAQDVQLITQIDPLPCGGDCSGTWDTEFDVPQQYDIVQMQFVPQGAGDQVLAVDAVDTGAGVYLPGQAVSIAYAAANPRAAQIIGGTHSHHWKNMIGFVLISLAGLLLLGLLAFAWDWLTSRFNRLLAARRPPSP